MAAYAFKEDAIWVEIGADGGNFSAAINSIVKQLEDGTELRVSADPIKENLDNYQSQTKTAVHNALMEIAQDIYDLSQQMVPIDIEALKISGRIQPQEGYDNPKRMDFADMKFRIGYGNREIEIHGRSQKVYRFFHGNYKPTSGEEGGEAAKEALAGPRGPVLRRFGQKASDILEMKDIAEKAKHYDVAKLRSIAKEHGIEMSEEGLQKFLERGMVEAGVDRILGADVRHEQRRARELEGIHVEEKGAKNLDESNSVAVLRIPYNYAVVQHENLTFKHEQGNAKYLELAYAGRLEHFRSILRKHLDRIKGRRRR